MANIIQVLDEKAAELLASWNIYSTVLLLATVGFGIWALASQVDPDTHPLLLARQAQASYVRQPGESAIFRSPEVPHGFPLKSGLSVKPPGALPYSMGRDGDLRDIWRRVTGELPLEKDNSGTGKARILTALGTEVTEHDIQEISREISVIGRHLQDSGAKRVAVYLPNSIELLAALFAGAFYGFAPILIPYNQPQPALAELLRETKADAIIAEAGSLSLAEISKVVPGIRGIIWVVEKTSRHMDWNEVPEGIGGKVDVAVWHELVQEQKNGSYKLPKGDTGDKVENVITVWQERPGAPAEVVEFTQKNIVAAVGALISAIPANQRMTRSDLVLIADSLTHSYALCLTLAALHSQASVALNSVAGPGVSLGLAAQCLAPTIIVASAETAAELHSNTSTSLASALKKFAHYWETKILMCGRMPGESFFTRLNAPVRASIGTTPGKLRLLFISERAGANTPPLSSDDLSDLRIFSGARVVYALTAAKVAGAVAQTHIYDYRRGLGAPNKHSHFGVPLSSLEIKLKDTAEHKTTDDRAAGEVVVRGPSVAGGEASLGFSAVFNDDNTLAYA